MGGYQAKHSYTVTCSSKFRDAVSALAEKRKVNVADLARSILLAMPNDVIASFPDPGEPDKEDRDEVVLKSGPSQGRPWRRKPRLQVRLPFGASIPMIRRALGLALATDKEDMKVSLSGNSGNSGADNSAESKGNGGLRGGNGADESEEALQLRDENERLRALLSVMSFDPLHEGVKTRQDALHILGFHPESKPDMSSVKARFRMLATVHHPDSDFGNHQRMSQLNQAISMLQRGRG
jgi:hypothetical protein